MMPKGTCDYALEYDAWGSRVLVQTAPAGRTCPVCGVRLSIYNHDELCAHCEVRAAEPLSQEAILAMFEAVCAALAAPWDMAAEGVKSGRGVREPYMSVREAARELGVSRRAVEAWCKTGVLKTKPKRTPGAPWKVVPGSVRRLKKERS